MQDIACKCLVCWIIRASLIVLCLVFQLCLTLCNPMDSHPSGYSVHGDSPGKNTGVDCHTLLQASHIAGGFFTIWATPGKPKNTGVGSLFLLQRIFPTQKSNWGVPCCRQFLYQLSYQWSPFPWYDSWVRKFPWRRNKMPTPVFLGFPGVAQIVKNPPAMPEAWIWKIPWRRSWQPIPVFLPWRIPWTEEPSGLQSMGSQRVGHAR